MNAIQFIKENGVEKAREVVSGAPDGATHLSDDESQTLSGYANDLEQALKGGES